MGAAQILGASVAGSAILSGLVVGSAELYRKTMEQGASERPEEDDEEK